MSFKYKTFLGVRDLTKAKYTVSFVGPSVLEA